MAIDDSFDAVEKHYPESKAELSTEAAAFIGGLAIPKLSILFEAFGIAIRHFSTRERIDRALAFIHALIDRVKSLERRGDASEARINELAEALQIACYRDTESFNDIKRDRYLAVLANAVKEPVNGLVSYIQDIERLNEIDIDALRLLFEVFPQRWDLIATQEIHPNDFIQKAEELLMKAVPDATGRPVRYEDFYATCGRLAGFGLAIEVQMPHRMVPTGKFVFRPSARGLKFLDLLK